MSDENKDHLTDMLKEGWTIAGYSSCLMAAGAMVHNLLLQKDSMLTTINIVISNGKELGRTVNIFAPQAPKEKGFFERIEEETQMRRQAKEDAKQAKKLKKLQKHQ